MKQYVPGSATIPAVLFGLFAAAMSAMFLLITLQVRRFGTFEGIHFNLARSYIDLITCILIAALGFWAWAKASRSRIAFYVCVLFSVLMLLASCWLAFDILSEEMDWLVKAFNLILISPLLAAAVAGLLGARII
jgi:hypothetical protein